MSADYRKLWIMIIEKNITKPKLREMASLSPSTLTKLNKNQYVSMDILARICCSLKCNIGDVVDFVEDKQQT